MALEAKLDVLLADASSSAYEAQQLAVTLFKRKQKLSQPGGAALISRAVAALARRGEDAVSSALAAELAAFLKTEKKNKRTPEPGTEAAVEAILNALSGDSAKTAAALFARAGMRATVVAHHLRRREFGLAQLHALRLEDAQTQTFAMETCAAEWAFSVDTKEEERDLIVARAVLEVLARGNEAGANRVWMECEKRRGKNTEPSPLLNCVACLMEIVRLRSANGRDAAFELCARYSPSLERDPALPLVCLSVVNRFFPEKSAGRGMGGGGLMDMLSGLFGGGGGGGAAPTREGVVDIDD